MARLSEIKDEQRMCGIMKQIKIKEGILTEKVLRDVEKKRKESDCLRKSGKDKDETSKKTKKVK